MTAATISSNGHRPAPEELRAAARDAYRASLAAGAPLSGAALGRRFGMSERWGRDRVTEVQGDQNPTSGHHRAPGRDAGTTTRDEPPENREPEPASDRLPASARSVVAPAAPVPPAVPEAAEDTEERPEVGGSWLDSVIILTVALVAAAASYGHMLEVAVWAGEPLWLARAFPVTVDGLVLAALRRGRQGRWWLALGIAVSVAANMLARYPDLAAAAGPVVSAWPPLALFGTHRLLQARRAPR
jgi:hypothetical protein